MTPGEIITELWERLARITETERIESVVEHIARARKAMAYVSRCGFVCKCARPNNARGVCNDACDYPKGHAGKHFNCGHPLSKEPRL